jgi:hypothetical protein
MAAALSNSQRDAKQVEDDARSSYEAVSSATVRRGSAMAQLQKLAKVFLKWDAEFSRPTRKAARALKELAGVPSSAPSVVWAFEQSLREAFAAAIREEAEADARGDEEYLLSAEHSANEAVRSAFTRALRVDADPTDLAKVNAAIKAVGEED